MSAAKIAIGMLAILLWPIGFALGLVLLLLSIPFERPRGFCLAWLILMIKGPH
jgi:hypothetical protein